MLTLIFGRTLLHPIMFSRFFFFHIHFIYLHIHIIMVLYKEWSSSCVSCVIVVRLIICGEHVKELDSYGVGCKFAQKRCVVWHLILSLLFMTSSLLLMLCNVWNYCTKLLYYYGVLDPCGVGCVILSYCFC